MPDALVMDMLFFLWVGLAIGFVIMCLVLIIND